MATSAEWIEELLKLLREVDLLTFCALDQRLHLLLEQKGKDQPGTE